MRRNLNMRSLLAALLMTAMVILPCASLALGDYDDDAMKAYCEAWTSYYESAGPVIDLTSSLNITAWAHGRSSQSSAGTKDTIAHMLTADTSPATFYVKADACYANDTSASIIMVDDHLSEMPEGLSIRFGKKTLVGAYRVFSTNEHYHEFTFDVEDMMELTEHLLGSGNATLLITSSKGEFSVVISKTLTPKLVEMLRQTRDGRRYGDTTGAYYKRSSLLPSGTTDAAKPTPKPTAKPTPEPTPVEITGTVISKIAGNAGPGTGKTYGQMGTWDLKGQQVRVISKAPLDSEKWWLQVELDTTEGLIRCYTGSQRLDCTASELRSVPKEKALYTAVLNSDCQPTTGPGGEYATQYIAYDRHSAVRLSAGTRVTVYATENGCAQIEYTYRSNGLRYRSWVPLWMLD